MEENNICEGGNRLNRDKIENLKFCDSDRSIWAEPGDIWLPPYCHGHSSELPNLSYPMAHKHLGISIRNTWL